MDDVEKCLGELPSGKQCPIRDRCCRYTSQNKDGQYYFWYLDAPYDETKQYCAQYMDNKDWK